MFRKSVVSILSLNFLVFIALFAAASSAYAAHKGETIFQLCTACHGSNGEGNKVLQAPAIAGLPAWYIKAQVEKFRSGARGAHPEDAAGLRMRPMARTLYGSADIESVSQYVSKLAPAKLARELKGSVIAGEAQFKICASCHGAKAQGQQVMNAPPLTIANDWYLLKQLQNFKNGLRGADGSKDPTGATMKGMAGLLDKQAMHDVIVYIQTLK